MLRDDVRSFAELNRSLEFAFGRHDFARRSRSASASFAIARCILSGSVMSLISTAVTCVPHGSVCESMTSLICSLIFAVSREAGRA